MPVYEFTCLVEGVDLLDDRTLDAIDEHSAGYLADPPLEDATFIRDGGEQKAVFSCVAESYDAAVAVATAALREALPDISIRSVVPGRHPGACDLL